jgi:hypothetical protein
MPAIEQAFGNSSPAATVGDSPKEVDGGNAVKRKLFLCTLAGSAAGLVFGDPVSDFLASAVREPHPGRVGLAEVGQVRALAQMFARQDHGFVGGLSAEAVVTQLSVSANLLDGRFSYEAVRLQLFSAMAELADVAAGMCFDAGAHGQAQQCFQFAVGCATEAGDWAMRAKALSGLANLAVHGGQRDDALSMAEMALVRADRLPPVTRAVMYTRHARALGLNGVHREPDCLAATDQAEQHFAAGTGDEPSWMAYYTCAHLERDIGRALLHLAVNGGDPTKAQARLQAAVTSFPAKPSRGKTLAIANLAHVTMSRDDPAHAAALGHTALDAMATVRSDRVFAALRQVRVAGQRHSRIAAVAELNQRLDGALPGTVIS